MHLIVLLKYFLSYSLGGRSMKESKQNRFFFTTFSDLWKLSTCSLYFVLYLAKSLVLCPIGFLLEYNIVCLKLLISCITTYTSLLSSLFFNYPSFAPARQGWSESLIYYYKMYKNHIKH